MSGQQVLVLDVGADPAEVAALRAALARRRTVLTAPTAEAKSVVRRLGVADPRPELTLAPVAHSDAARDHALESLVRGTAVADRYRDVVVVCDGATAARVVRLLGDGAPTGTLTRIWLPRPGREMPAVGWPLVLGLVLALLAGLLSSLLHVLALPAMALVGGAVLLVAPSLRHVAYGLLVAGGSAALVVLLGISSAARFPGS